MILVHLLDVLEQILDVLFFALSICTLSISILLSPSLWTISKARLFYL
jgi:hypothetical protein